MSVKSSQENRYLKISTPFGEDEVLLETIYGGEAFSKLFQYHLDLIVDIREGEKTLSPKDIIGKPVAVSISGLSGQTRYIHGFVNSFEYRGQDDFQAFYGATIVPWMWFLTQRSDCRIFQNKKVPDIISEVFNELGFNDFDTSYLTATYEPREYCVQYRETDYEFVCRLMEEEGIFFYFKHEASKHTLVLADTKSSYFDLPDNKLEHKFDKGDSHFQQLSSWRHSYEFQSGKVAFTDYNFEKPSMDLMSNHNSSVGFDKMDQLEIYDYPGRFYNKGEGRKASQGRIESYEARHDVAFGSGNYQSIAVGGRFTLSSHSCSAEEGKEYVVSGIQLRANVDAYRNQNTADEAFHCDFQCIPAKTLFRPTPDTRKPIVEGPQTAVVVGPAGEEIYVDEFGRVKVQFHWDRLGQNNETSSCWIRCAQNIAGNKWGFMFIPRIGQEVVVEFLEGNPDCPLITAGVYNGMQKPHYELPDAANKMYIKSNTTKGGDGFNEFMFDDTKDAERVFLHAEKDYDLRVKNDARERVIGNQHHIVGWEKDGNKGGDLKQKVFQDKHANIKRNQTEHIEGNMQLTVGEGEADGGVLDVVIEKQEKRKIGDDGLHVEVGGDHSESVGGNLSFSVGGGIHASASDVQIQAGAGGEVHLKAGKIIIEATQQVSMIGPGGFVDVGPGGVTIQGTMVKINSGGAAGSGGACSPAAPEPAEIAAPIEPDVAHDSTTGFKSNI